MREVSDLIGAQRAAATGMLGPTVHAGLEKRAVDHQLAAPLKQVEEADLTLGGVERVVFLDAHPRHGATLGGERVTSAGRGFFFYQQLLAGGFPLLRRHYGRRVHLAVGHCQGPFKNLVLSSRRLKAPKRYGFTRRPNINIRAHSSGNWRYASQDYRVCAGVRALRTSDPRIPRAWPACPVRSCKRGRGEKPGDAFE